MLTQLKTVVLIKETIKLALSIWSISICGFDYRLKMARNKDRSSETHQSILVLRNEGYSMREIAKKLKISYNAVYYSLHRTTQTGSRVSSLRNRHLTSPQLAASLNSTHKTPASTSTLKRWLQDARLLGRVAKKKPYLRLANKNKKRLRWAKEHRHQTQELCLECQDPGVAFSLLTLRLVFCGYYLMKLPVEDLWGVCFSN